MEYGKSPLPYFGVPRAMNGRNGSSVQRRKYCSTMNLSGLSRATINALLLGSSLLALGGCVVGRQTPFNPAEFSGALRKGSGVVTGRVSVDTQNVGTIHPHFQPVLLVPVNTYTTENVQRRFVGGENLQKSDKRILQFERNAETDGNGNFTFRGVPAGEYYLEGELPWITSYLSTDDQGARERLYVAYFKYYFARVSVKDRQTAQVAQFDQRGHERHTHYATGDTLYHPPSGVEVFEQ